MVSTTLLSAVLVGAAASLVVAAPAAAPAPTAAASLDKRAGSCTFSGASGAAAVSKSKASCATITLSSVAVPSGTTLDLTKLTKGTKVSMVNFHQPGSSTDPDRSSSRVPPASATRSGRDL